MKFLMTLRVNNRIPGLLRRHYSVKFSGHLQGKGIFVYAEQYEADSGPGKQKEDGPGHQSVICCSLMWPKMNIRGDS